MTDKDSKLIWEARLPRESSSKAYSGNPIGEFANKQVAQGWTTGKRGILKYDLHVAELLYRPKNTNWSGIDLPMDDIDKAEWRGWQTIVKLLHNDYYGVNHPLDVWQLHNLRIIEMEEVRYKAHYKKRREATLAGGEPEIPASMAPGNIEFRVDIQESPRFLKGEIIEHAGFSGDAVMGIVVSDRKAMDRFRGDDSIVNIQIQYLDITTSGQVKAGLGRL